MSTSKTSYTSKKSSSAVATSQRTYFIQHKDTLCGGQIMDFNQRRVLATLPTSLHQMTNSVAVDDQLKGIPDPDLVEASPSCSEAVKENVCVTYANLFEFNRTCREVVIKDSPPQESIILHDCQFDHIHRQSTSDFDRKHFAAVSNCKTSKKQSVSFAPSCQVLHIGNDTNQAYYLCHEAVKEGSSQGCFDGEIGHVLGLKKRKNTQEDQGSFDSDVGVTTRETSKKASVRFAPSCLTVHLIDNQTEGIEDELWYSQNDFLDFEDEACRHSQMIRDSESHGTFDVELEHILGLEKIILFETYFDRRDALRQTVLNEQAVQQLVKDLRSRSYRDDSNSNAEDVSLVHLAKTSERLSLWARERASMAAFTLEHDLLPA